MNQEFARRAATCFERYNYQLHNTVSSTLISFATAGVVGLAGLGVAQAQVVPGSPQCVIGGTTVTCTGNLSSGIEVDRNDPLGPFETLNVNNVDPLGIAPANNVGGVRFESMDNNGLNLNVDTTGTAGITVNGIGEGINVDIITGGSGNLIINSTGTIMASSSGIDAENSGSSGDVRITNIGDVISTDNIGIGGTRDPGGDGDVFIDNTGAIMANSSGIFSINAGTSGDVTITNNGDVTSSGSFGIVGFRSIGGDGDVVIESTSNIMANLQGIFGVNSGGLGYVTITSNGNVNSATAAGIGVNADGIGRINITSSGSVSGITGIEVEVRDNNAAATITNSGIVTGIGGTAINLQGDGNDTVNLLPGSVINGAVDFGNGNDGTGGTNPNDVDTLNFGPGINDVIVFEDVSGTDSDLASAPENINAAGSVVLLHDADGVRAVVVDGTAFAAQQTFIGDITTSIFNGIDGSGPGVGSGGSTHGGVGDDTSVSHVDSLRLWGSVFGGFSDSGDNDNLVEFEHSFGGILTGVESASADGDSAIGLFGGYSQSNIGIEFGAGNSDIDTFFGGAYWKQDYGSHRINLAFAAGVTDNENTRDVGGLDANGDFDGWFFAPSATIAAPIDTLSVPAYLSGRVSYVGLSQDGYTETGAAPGLLTVDDRDIGIFNLRGQLTIPQTTLQGNGNHTHIEWRAGVDANFNVGDDIVNATVAGTPFLINAETDDDVSGFTGVDITHTSADGMKSFTFSGELQSDFDSGYQALGEIRTTFRF